VAKLNVSKWQAARRGPAYTPVLQFFWRQIKMAIFEALRVGTIECPYADIFWTHPASDTPHKGAMVAAGNQWDMAIMARDWIARRAPDPKADREGWIVSFDAACIALGCDPDTERLWMLEKIDAAADFDTDEVWARIEYLTANPPDETEEALFDAPRCVPVLDQGNLFAMGAM
jgi:hypothetical protein